MKATAFLIIFLSIPCSAHAQPDTATHGWPVPPFLSTHPITGVFCEFRNTLTADHFHNGTDVPSPDGTPVYPVHDGIVSVIGTVAGNGDNAYVRIHYTGDAVWSGKSDAYVHIAPNPVLSPGDPVFAYSTVLGTILPGLGHTHFTNGAGSGEMNAIRPVGGFAPYIDSYPPKILWVRFFIDETETELLGGRVSGLVDIRSYIVETSAADPSGISSSTTNNGVFIAGYKILTADRSAVAFEPPDGGVRYRFDYSPGDADVHRVFATGSDLSTPIYTLTNGGGAGGVNATRTVPNNFWDTGSLPAGDYTVMVFAQDTRGLADTAYIPVRVVRDDLVPPSVPVLRFVGSDSTNRITIRWYHNPDPDLAGYRLEFSTNGSAWTQKEDETKLGKETTSISYPLSSGTLFFRLAAVDSAAPPNVGGYSDAYGLRLNSGPGAKTLIVDGFDRTETSGSYHAPSHEFAMTAGISIPGDFNSCANEALTDSSVLLAGYDVVDWLLGDESSNDETFSAGEQPLVSRFLAGGGKLLVTGSEIAYDLDRPNGPTQADRDFLHQELKVGYAGDNAGDFNVAGSPGSVMQVLAFRYGVVGEGSPYPEDWPDYFTVQPGALPLLYYGAPGGLVAAVGYEGVFPGGTVHGAVVTCGFPFETITSRTVRDTVMRRFYEFMNTPTGVGSDIAGTAPATFALEQNYPNPFNPETMIRYQVPEQGPVRVAVVDILGREVARLVEQEQAAGSYTVRWNASRAASGIYFCRLTAGGKSAVKKMMVLR